MTNSGSPPRGDGADVQLAFGTSQGRWVIAATVLGLVAFAFCSLALAAFLIFRTELTQYANCMSGANTTATQTACQNQLDNGVRNEIKLLGGR